MNTLKRNNSYDLLRIISCIAVVLVHVNYLYFGEIAFLPERNYLWIVESFINIVTRFCVPCFVMISGAFLLSNNKNEDFLMFYKKRLTKILLPTFVIGFAILVYSSITARNISQYITQIIEGTFYNYWYIYMTIGLYLLTPFIIKLKKQLTVKQYVITTIILFGWAIISQATTIYRFPYSIGVVFAFVSYFMMGNIIFENSKKIKLNNISLIIIALISFGLTFIWRYIGHNNVMFVSDAYANFFSPLIIVFSVSIFTLFTKLEIKTDFNKYAKYTLYIYLFHTFVYTSIYPIINMLSINELLKIVIIFILTVIGSAILSIIYDKLSNFWFKNKK